MPSDFDQAMREYHANNLIRLAWQGGDPALREGWRHYVDHELKQLEGKFPGIRAQVAAEINRRKAEQEKADAVSG